MNSASKILSLFAVAFFPLLVSADNVYFLSSGKIYFVDPNSSLPKLTVQPLPEENITSFLVLPRRGELIYATSSRAGGKATANIWKSALTGENPKELLQTKYTKIEKLASAPDERAILFQGRIKDTLSVGHLNLEKGKFTEFKDSSSPQFLDEGKIIFCTQPSRAGFCYHSLIIWNPATNKSDTLFQPEQTCNRIIGVFPPGGLIAVVRSDSLTRMNEYIDILDIEGRAKIPQAAASIGLIQISAGPKFNSNGKQIAWVAEHRLFVTDIARKETKTVMERIMMSDSFTWSPDGNWLLFGYNPPPPPKDCLTCNKTIILNDPGIFMIDRHGNNLKRLTFAKTIEKEIYWAK